MVEMNSDVLQGWVCPLCGVVKAPWVEECHCHAVSHTVNDMSDDDNWKCYDEDSDVKCKCGRIQITRLPLTWL